MLLIAVILVYIFVKAPKVKDIDSAKLLSKAKVGPDRANLIGGTVFIALGFLSFALDYHLHRTAHAVDSAQVLGIFWVMFGSYGVGLGIGRMRPHITTAPPTRSKKPTNT